jgi:4-hydroxy-2-oxoheptanedioate aldolase
VPDPRYPSLAARMRARERAVGYWVTQDNPVATERIAGTGYDYVVLDAQHGLLGCSALLAGLTAVDAAGQGVGMVRVEANDVTCIGQALDAGAGGVIVPLVDDAAGAGAAVAAAKYPPAGRRSYGPMRSRMRIGPTPADSDAATLVFVMIETAPGLTNAADICATPGLDGIYVGTSDLRIALGGASPDDPSVSEEFEAALETLREVAATAGIAAGIHTTSGQQAAQRLGEGYTFATIASDLVHLEQIAADHLAAANGGAPTASPAPGH